MPQQWKIDRLVALAGFQGVREGMQGRRPAFSGACGNSWWNSTSERPSIIRHFSAQVCGDRGNRHLAPDYRLHNLVSCQTVATMKAKHQSTVNTSGLELRFLHISKVDSRGILHHGDYCY